MQHRFLPAFLLRIFEERPDLRQIVGNTGWLLADRMLRMGVVLLVTIWVSRYLGPEQFGILSYATTFVTLFSSLTMLSMDAVVVRNIVRNPSCRDEILGTTFVVRLAAGAGAFLLTLIACVMFSPPDQTSRMLVGIIAVGLLFQSFGTIDFWFQSQVQSRYAASARSAATLLTCAAKVALILLKAPLAAFAWVGLGDIVLGAIGLVLAYRLAGNSIKCWRPTKTMTVSLLRDTWPLVLSEVVIMVHMRIDKILVGSMAGNAELGIYAAAALVAEAFYFLPSIACSTLFPGIVKAERENDSLFRERLQHLYNLMALLGYAVAVPVTLLSGWAVPQMFGGPYAKAGPMVTGLVWAGLFVNMATARSYFLTLVNWTRLHFIVDLLGCIVNVTLNIVLIPRFGGMGAVAASLVSCWFVAHGSCFLFKPLATTGIMMTKALLYPRIWQRISMNNGDMTS
jgi:O-antigen/teichoic acid export membrane protein